MKTEGMNVRSGTRQSSGVSDWRSEFWRTQLQAVRNGMKCQSPYFNTARKPEEKP
jgi:hypothetical protein